MKSDKDVITLMLYVDDVILNGSSETKIQQVVLDLAEVFDLKDMSKFTYFLRLQIQYQEDGSLFISQSRYARDLLHKTGIDH